MPMFKIILEDTVTYARRVLVEVTAEDEAAAIDLVLDDAGNIISAADDEQIEEGQIDNTPYSAELAEHVEHFSLKPINWTRASNSQETDMKCEECDDKGFRIATRAEGLLAIERCDTCERFESDEDALNHVEQPGDLPIHIHIEPDTPCYLWVSLNGRSYRLSAYQLTGSY